MSDAQGTGGDRVPVAKTFKHFVGGAFVRSEGGKVLRCETPDGQLFGHVPRGTRKDLRDAVLKARAAQAGWAGKSAMLRSQILYRFAEMLEDRAEVFARNLATATGTSAERAAAEVRGAVERAFWYAGWCDKFGPVLGSVNPVASSHFNFTVPEPVGVVVVAAPRGAPLLGCVSAALPALVPGNSVLVLVDGPAPSVGLDLGEVAATCDLPAGVLNILSGKREEMLPTAAGHRDVDALASYGDTAEERAAVEEAAADNLKRLHLADDHELDGWLDAERCSPWAIAPFIEWKTAWHPVGT